MKYKVGDRVKYDSEICTVTKVLESQGKFKYRVQSDTWFDVVEDEMIEGLVEEEDLIPKFGEFSDNEPLDIPTMTTEFVKEHGLPCPEGYIFKDESGNVINATKIVLEKKKTEYPKTYEECCKELNIAVRDLDILDNMLDTTEIIYNKNLDRLLNSFRKLLICRDAYWKIAGDEMGLGKPWEPDWNDGKLKWCMSYSGNYIEFDQYKSKHHTLAFPTEEMGDAFKENFDPDLEICKELL